ncbi:hypothetical protein EDM52_18540 [Brevibacillus invocatus]|uniref:Uncharacterized protein n=2 Tax=Brevibacillus invocatus TaxID=173959 RepID=A0A3M8C2R9_9BACL|nr:hypothetical protein EDM52_18540 [Brevibacillus invocatus]
MLTIQNLTMLRDVISLPKESLKEICTNLNLPSVGTKDDLAYSIMGRIEGNRRLQNIALESVRDRILAGKTTVTWYSSAAQNSLRGAKELIIRNFHQNPFEVITVPDPGDLTSTPVLFSAAEGDSPHEYYLRFMWKSGVRRDYYTGTTSPIQRICNVYINEEQGAVEIRTEPKSAREVAQVLFSLIQQRTFMEETRILAPFGADVERFADALGGEFIDTSSKPGLLLDEFTQEQGEAIVQILEGLNDYFETEDIADLEDNLAQAKDVFGDNLLETPFTAIILAGLQRVSMGSDKELRGQPLYDFLSPFLQHQTGFIRFRYPVNGVFQSHTIRVGLVSNSIYFNTPATEEVIKHVRQTITAVV